VANTLAYYDMAAIMVVKYFIVQAPGRLTIDAFEWPMQPSLKYVFVLFDD
jgi:hypothetical protein